MHQAFAESATRNLAEAGIIRRAPPWRPKKGDAAFAYDGNELAFIFLTLAALTPAVAVGVSSRVLAEHIPYPKETTPGVIDPDTPLLDWLGGIFARLLTLSAEEHKAEYGQVAGAYIEFITDPDNIGEAAAATVRCEWGPSEARSCVVFKSTDTSLAEILSEPPRKYRATVAVRLDWALLLDLTAPPKKEPESENESAEAPARASAPIDQPATESLPRPTEPSNTSDRSSESARAPKR